ncbi:MAG: hypothetical protein NVS9B10_28480 [Nevskia sp.]
MSPAPRSSQRGGLLSLLLTVLAIGAVAYFALRGTAGGSHPLGDGQAAISCEQQISKLMAKTGGLGPEYQTGYDALPTSCRGLLPAPGALEPSPKRVEPES